MGEIIPYSAIILIGPTGSGKTPLGEYFEKKKLWGRRCVHFDFGANLRKIADDGPPSSKLLSDRDINTINWSLNSGALLEDKDFHIVKKVLVAFARRRRVKPDDIIILNGIPRHKGQAAGLEDTVNAEAVISLECALGVISERIRRNTGGDRDGRKDDSPGEIACKIKIFQQRTIPVIEHYRVAGAKIIPVRVEVSSTATDIAQSIEE
jgi:adenylate kinase